MGRHKKNEQYKQDIIDLIGDVADEEQDFRIELIKGSKLYENLYNYLLDKIDKNEALVDLVYDYMELYVTKSLLICDIERKGVVINTTSGNGFPVRKKNESITELTRINTQMLKILQHLNIYNLKDNSLDEWTL